VPLLSDGLCPALHCVCSTSLLARSARAWRHPRQVSESIDEHGAEFPPRLHFFPGAGHSSPQSLTCTRQLTVGRRNANATAALALLTKQRPVARRWVAPAPHTGSAPCVPLFAGPGAEAHEEKERTVQVGAGLRGSCGAAAAIGNGCADTRSREKKKRRRREKESERSTPVALGWI
jgi:hypothetical protein